MKPVRKLSPLGRYTSRTPAGRSKKSNRLLAPGDAEGLPMIVHSAVNCIDGQPEKPHVLNDAKPITIIDTDNTPEVPRDNTCLNTHVSDKKAPSSYSHASSHYSDISQAGKSLNASAAQENLRNSQVKALDSDTAAGPKAASLNESDLFISEHVRTASIIRNFEGRYEYFASSLEKLLPFLTTLRSEYLSVHEMHGGLVRSYNRQVRHSEALQNQCKKQTERISVLTDELQRQRDINVKLQNRNSTFMLYKKEVARYIELFKNNLKAQREEIEEAQRKSRAHKQTELEQEYRVDVLKRESVKYQAMVVESERDWKSAEANFQLLRGKIRNADERVSGLQQRFLELKDDRHQRNCIAYEFAIDRVRLLNEGLSEKCAGIRNIWNAAGAMLKYLSSAKIKEEETNSSLRQENRQLCAELEIARACIAKERKANGEVSRKAWQCWTALAQDFAQEKGRIEGRLRTLCDGLERLAKGIGACDRPQHLESIKKYYASLMNGQRKLFEAEKSKLLKRIQEQETRGKKKHKGKRQLEGKGNTGEDMDSDLWDVFKSK